jgi:hypothetical protein
VLSTATPVEGEQRRLVVAELADFPEVALRDDAAGVELAAREIGGERVGRRQGEAAALRLLQRGDAARRAGDEHRHLLARIAGDRLVAVAHRAADDMRRADHEVGAPRARALQLAREVPAEAQLGVGAGRRAHVVGERPVAVHESRGAQLLARLDGNADFERRGMREAGEDGEDYGDGRKYPHGGLHVFFRLS